jgi:parvulin-like peptidyl-prolyl isomerase
MRYNARKSLHVLLLPVLALSLCFGCGSKNGGREKAESRDKAVSSETKQAVPSQIGASHILISYQGVQGINTTRSKDDAKKLAEDILNRITSGEDFETLAKEHSDCPSSAKGGDLGTFGKGRMVKPFEEAAYSLDVGGISNVVETKFGYHIIKRTR